MSYYTLALSASSHDSSICLMEDSDIVVAYSCERTSRKKHTSSIAAKDLETILEHTKHVDQLIIVNFSSTNESVMSRPKSGANKNEIVQVVEAAGLTYSKLIVDNDNHHLYHAAAGYYTSGLSNAVCIIMDGAGSIYKRDDALLYENTTFFHAEDKIKTTYKVMLYRHNPSLSMTGWTNNKLKDSANKTWQSTVISSHLDIGQMYGTVTRHIGFATVDAGKTMGLSAYGKPNGLPPMLVPGKFISNANVFRNDAQLDTLAYPELGDITEELKRDLSYNVQRALEEIFVHRVETALKIKYSDNVIIGGGCALNILGNSVVKKKFPFLNVYPEPIASDASQSMGAALYHYKMQFPETKYKKLNNLFLGPHYSKESVKSKLLELLERYNNESTL